MLFITALIVGQPFGVWYALLLPGVLTTLLMAIFLVLVVKIWIPISQQRRLEAEEFRRGT